MNRRKTSSRGLYFSADHFSADHDFCKPPPEDLRGTTRIQVLVVRIERMSHSVLICEIREIRGQ